MPLKMYGYILELSVKQLAIQSIPNSIGEIICGALKTIM